MLVSRMELAGVLLFLYSIVMLLHSQSVTAVECVDITSYASCNVSGFAAENHRMCYKTSIEGNVCNPDDCIASHIPRTSFGVKFLPSIANRDDPIQTKIWSQGNLRGRNYRNRRYCQYHVSCPPGQLLHFGYRTGKMEIEPATAGGLCLDYVTIENFSEENTQLCGSHLEKARQRDGPLRVEFRSNSRGQFPGFQIDILCVSPIFSNLPGCRASPDFNSANIPTAPPLRDRRRRENDHKVKRSIPLTGNQINIPRNGGFWYYNNRLQVVVDGLVVRQFLRIRRVIFWTRSKGSQEFYKSTEHYFYGSGELSVVKDCVYYTTFDIPPQLEPTPADLKLINILLNATTRYFEDQDVIDEEPRFLPPPLPYKLHLPYIRKRRVTADAEAMATAMGWENACNVFLRESALSYLLLVREGL